MAPCHISLKLPSIQIEQDFPEKGLVLVTASTGAGKSIMCIDSVAWSLFGDGPRGRLPEGLVKLETHEGLSVERERKRGKVGLCWADLDPGNRLFESVTKSQKALEEVLGWDYLTWYRATVLTVQEPATFTTATDKGRKALIEELVPGFARFDPALEMCREDLKLAVRKRDTAAEQVRWGQIQCQMMASDVHRLREAVRVEVDWFHEWEVEQNRLVRLIDENQREQKRLKRELDKLEERYRAISRYQAKLEAEYDAAYQKTLEAAGRRNRLDQDQCPTCGQEMPESLRSQVREDEDRAAEEARRLLSGVELGKKELGEDLVNLDTRRRQFQAALKELEQSCLGVDKGNMGGLLKELADVSERRKTSLDQQKRHAEAEARIQAAEAALKEREQTVQEIEMGLPALEKEVAELEAATQVLGLKGARVYLLDKVLLALESLVNSYLTRFWPEVTVKLPRDPEDQKIGLEVEGAGDGGYKSLSRGQRMLLDWAFFFGRRDLLLAGMGRKGDFCVVDEGLDGLDIQRTIGVTEYLWELSRDQLVVVISHSALVKEQLHPDVHITLPD